MAINETVKLILALIIGAAVLFGVQKVLDWREAAQQNEQRGRTITATSGIINDGSKADADRTTTDTGISQGRQEFHDNQQEAKRNEPETAARADRAVPASVRNNFRARRLARERSGCVGDECQARPPASASSER